MTEAQQETFETNRQFKVSRAGGRSGLCYSGLLLAGLLPLLLTGCTGGGWNLVRGSSSEDGSIGNGFDIVRASLFGKGIPAGEVHPALDKAKDLYRQKEYGEAGDLFNRVARSKHTPPSIAEEALYYEAECQRMRGRYPRASEIYSQLVTEYPRGAFHHLALQRMFDIANYWLDATRETMKATNEQKDGKRMIVWPVSFVHFEKTKPLLDMEGRALALLEKVYLNDIDGPLGERALFFLGSVNFYRENYRDADHYFHQVVKFHPDGKLAPQALELSIMCKQLIPGGPEYDGRTVAEARELVHTAMTAYPELAHEKSDFLERQLFTINVQQAERDLKIANFYRRTGHPGSAYFCYEIVRRRYPGTKHAEIAEKRMNELRERAERERLGENNQGFAIPNPFSDWFSPKQTEPEPSSEFPGPSVTPTPYQPELAPMPRPVGPSPVMPSYGAYPGSAPK